MLFEGAEDFVFVMTDRPLQPRREHLADAVVVAHGCAALLDRIENTCVISLELRRIVHPRDENPVQVGSLRIDV